MSAYGDDPTVHAIRHGRFVCTADPDAPCRTSPTCENCEHWCGCDGSEQDAADNHDLADGEHCCMLTKKPGQSCWIEPLVNGDGIEESWVGNVIWPVPDDLIDPRPRDEDGCPGDFPDGPVTVDWDHDYCTWAYAGGAA